MLTKSERKDEGQYLCNMDLREPKKKKKVKIQNQSPLPIPIGGSNEWVLYTAQLTDLGACIVNPDEIVALHTMGFFGKGSLSRSYPSFGKSRYGAPPIIRNRQWIRRQEWLKEVKDLNEDSLSGTSKNINWEKCDFEDGTTEHNHTNNILVPLRDGEDILVEDKHSLPDDKCDNISLNHEDSNQELTKLSKESLLDLPDIIEISKENKEIENEVQKTNSIDEIDLDSTEEDNMSVIVNRENEKYEDQCSYESGEQSRIHRADEFFTFHNYDYKESDRCVNKSNADLHGKLLVLPDSDSDTEDYLKKVKPKIENEGFPIREALHLTFEETFFLLFGLGCLQVINFDGSLLDINSAWLYFCKVDKDFVQKYVVYHYFRSKGWVVKPGLKYGGNFLLYKQGPPFYHASYIVIVDVVDADSLVRDPLRCTRKITWNNLFGLDRLSETAAKEILFAQVLWPSSIPRNCNPSTPDNLSEFTVKELLWRRWNPKQNRDVINIEEDDEDSN